MNILISVNEGYLEHAKTMLFSVKINTSESVDVYMLNHALSPNLIEDFRNYLNKYDITLHVLDTSDTGLDDMPIVKSHFSIEMYYRIIAQFILPKELDRILWLDADLVAIKDLSPFYNQDLDDNFMAVCADLHYDSDEVAQIKEKVGIAPENIYFNSGVLLLNLPKLRQETDMNNILQCCSDLRNKLSYPDQDILNFLYQGKVKYCDQKVYNYQVLDSKKIEKSIEEKAVIIHYTGFWKPWKIRFIVNASKHYWRIKLKQGCWFEYIKMHILNLAYRILHKLHLR